MRCPLSEHRLEPVPLVQECGRLLPLQRLKHVYYPSKHARKSSKLLVVNVTNRQEIRKSARMHAVRQPRAQMTIPVSDDRTAISNPASGRPLTSENVCRLQYTVRLCNARQLKRYCSNAKLTSLHNETDTIQYRARTSSVVQLNIQIKQTVFSAYNLITEY